MNALQKACQLDPGNHHFLHLLVTAVRSNVAVEPAEALRVLKRLDLEQYHDACADLSEVFDRVLEVDGEKDAHDLLPELIEFLQSVDE